MKLTKDLFIKKIKDVTYKYIVIYEGIIPFDTCKDAPKFHTIEESEAVPTHKAIVEFCEDYKGNEFTFELRKIAQSVGAGINYCHVTLIEEIDPAPAPEPGPEPAQLDPLNGIDIDELKNQIRSEITKEVKEKNLIQMLRDQIKEYKAELLELRKPSGQLSLTLSKLIDSLQGSKPKDREEEFNEMMLEIMNEGKSFNLNGHPFLEDEDDIEDIEHEEVEIDKKQLEQDLGIIVKELGINTIHNLAAKIKSGDFSGFVKQAVENFANT